MKICIDKEQLEKLLETMSEKEVARYLAHSHRTVRRRIKEHGIDVYKCRYRKYPAELNDHQMDLVTGCLLGDACIPHIKRMNRHFSFGQVDFRKEYVEHVNNILQPFSRKITYCNNGKNDKCRFVTAQLPLFTNLRHKWYAEDRHWAKKIIPVDLQLNWRSISYWFADDGYNNPNKKGATFCTNGFTFREAEFLKEVLARDVGLTASIRKSFYPKYQKTYPLLYVGGNCYDLLIDSIYPHLQHLKCLEYKISKEIRERANYKCKLLSEEQVKEVRKLHRNKECTVGDISLKFGVSISTIERCIYQKVG